MDNNNNSNEISLKRLVKIIVTIINEKKKFFIKVFIVLFLISLYFFVSNLFNPQYKANLILKSKYIKFEQLYQLTQKYNYYIEDPNSNPLDSALQLGISNSDIAKLDIIELKDERDNNKEKEDKFRLFKMTINFKSMPNEYKMKCIPALISDIQLKCVQDNEVSELAIKYQNTINELDSLIRVAYVAGNSYKDKLSGAGSGQLLIMNDIYKGISDLLNQKVHTQNTLAMLNKENIVFQSATTVVSKKIEYPWIIFAISISIWVFICVLWIIGTIIFRNED